MSLSWAADDQLTQLPTKLSRAIMKPKLWSRSMSQVRSMNDDNEDNDNNYFLHDIERRSPSNNILKQVFELTNQARRNGRYCGSSWYPATTQLEWNDRLGNAAQKHAQSMLTYNYFSHTGIDGSSFVDRIAAAGYSRNCAAAENIAGNQTPEATVNAWIKSSGHCANLMSKDSKVIGVGYAKGGPYGGYWVQKFGRC